MHMEEALVFLRPRKLSLLEVQSSVAIVRSEQAARFELCVTYGKAKMQEHTRVSRSGPSTHTANS